VDKQNSQLVEALQGVGCNLHISSHVSMHHLTYDLLYYVQKSEIQKSDRIEKYKSQSILVNSRGANKKTWMTEYEYHVNHRRMFAMFT